MNLNFLSLFIIFTLSSYALTQSSNKTCQALVLEGGGDKGAYQAGVLWGLTFNSTNPDIVKYDVVTGISVGSINALGVAMYEIGDEQNLVYFLNETWRNLSKSDVCVPWPGGSIEAWLFKPSLDDNTPLRNTLDNLITMPLYRRVVVGTTDANSGLYVTFNENDIDNNQTFAAQTALFSSAIPVYFPYQVYENYAFQDGGVSKGFDVSSAVDRCMEIVDSQSQITIDIIVLYADSLSDVQLNDFNTIQMLMRYLELFYWSEFEKAIMVAREDYPEVNFRYVIQPSAPMPNNLTPMDFNPANIDYMINLGVHDAITALQEGEGVSFKRILEKARKSYNDRLYGVKHNAQ